MGRRQRNIGKREANGAYAVEDEWIYGLSGYSYEDVPLFLNSFTQEATGNWQVARPKKDRQQFLRGEWLSVAVCSNLYRRSHRLPKPRQSGALPCHLRGLL